MNTAKYDSKLNKMNWQELRSEARKQHITNRKIANTSLYLSVSMMVFIILHMIFA